MDPLLAQSLFEKLVVMLEVDLKLIADQLVSLSVGEEKDGQQARLKSKGDLLKQIKESLEIVVKENRRSRFGNTISFEGGVWDEV